MEAVDVRGRFVWHELLTRDAGGAKSFYSKLTGWKPQPWPLDPTYTVCHSEQGPTAGLRPISAEFPADMASHWVSHIGTRDVDGTAAAAVRAGGSLMKGPEDIKGAGRFALLKDPQGAVFAILDPENARAEAAVPPIGTFSWHELATTDNEAAFAFYSELFGWDAIVRMDMGPIGTYLIFGQNGVQRGGLYNKPADWQAPPNWLPYVHVPSSDAGFKTATGAGAKEMTAPMDVPGGRIATFTDPSGALFAIHSVSASQTAPGEKAAKPKSASKPKAKAAAPAKAKASAKSKPRAKPKAKAKVKTKVKAKAKTTAARRKPKKAARKPAKKTKSVRRKK
jgi:predicted enzyme related to lactoylglutathione lyase